MKEDTISLIIDVIFGIVIILILGGVILLLPYKEAAHRDSMEAVIIDNYLEDQKLITEETEPKNDTVIETEQSSDSTDAVTKVTTAASNYKGEIDSILIIDKIDMQKAIIRGPYNDYNLERYLFVTADQTSALGTDNYVIYGHCSRTYGHSFNRLEELEAGDTFRLIQGTIIYEYIVTNITRELRENAAPLLNTGNNTVQLVSCEKKIAEGFSEKRLIIVTAELTAAF